MQVLGKRTETIDGIVYGVTDFTKDGETISHSTRCVLQEHQTDDSTEQESPPYTEIMIGQLRDDNLILMDAMAVMFEEIMSLKEQINGGA